MNELMSQLDDYYRSQGIHSLDFHCAHRDSCSAACKNFTEAKASLVGPRYDEGTRVLVLSLDPGQGLTKAADRTLEALVRQHTNDDPEELHKHKHWYRTYETVAAVLSRLTGQEHGPRDVVGRFAHVNAAKCSHNLPNKKQAPGRLFKNCRGYLEHEIALLAPDIIITQGKRAAAVVEPWRKDSRSRVTQIGDHDAYWLELTHPTAWGGAYGEEKKTWPRRFARARRWLEKEGKLAVSTSCPFCHPEKERLILQQKQIRIIRDGYPISPGHALVVPKLHVASWEDATKSLRRALTDGIALAQERIRKEHAPDAFNIGINSGVAAGQTISHLHVHVIPRYKGDVVDPRGGVRWIIPERAAYWKD
jgi:diadenosine tetraphosphate (Ap4A) HIT family hydrolase